MNDHVKKVSLTYDSVNRMLLALRHFNSPISVLGKIALARNARALQASQSEYEYARNGLLLECIEDKARRIENPNAMLTVAEQHRFMPKNKALLATPVDVELYIITLYDASEGETPKSLALALDISKYKMEAPLVEDLLPMLSTVESTT